MLEPLIIPEAKLSPEPTGDLINWTYSDDGIDFDTLAGLGSRVTISECTADGVRGYQHHPWVDVHPAGFLVSFYSIHPYDEEGIGMWCEWSYSEDDGDTWSTTEIIFPEQDTVGRRDNNSGRVVIPMDVVIANGRCFLVAEVDDRDFTSGQNIRTGIGIVAIEIYSDKTYSDVFWIWNSDESNTAPSPVSGFDAYSFSQEFKDICFNYLYRPENNPKVNNAGSYYTARYEDVENFGTLAEGVTIKPKGYNKVWQYLKNAGFPDVTYPDAGNGYKVYTTDGANFFTSSVPDCEDNRSIVTRFTNYGDKIFISGNSQKGRRKQLFLAVCSRNESTGRFDTDNVYEIDIHGTYNDGDDVIAPDYEGDGKGGGPQSVDVCISNGKIYWIYSEKKESIHIKKWTIV